MSKKTDNHNPDAKLTLRRHFLNRYHVPIVAYGDTSIRVLDCCQASGRLWGVLRREFAGVEYWGVDVRPKKGRLKIDSVRILDQPGVTQNVIDIDTYGSPFKHWMALLRECAGTASPFS
ncbi:MAG: hypothetical protein V7609_2110 [Verrucomicrobiota bacterium]